MNFQWILLAFFVVALLSGMAKAITRPMLKNVLNFIAVPVAFLLTFIMQILGLFQALTDYVLSFVISYAGLSETVASFGGAISFITAFCSTLLSPMLFVMCFFIWLFLLRVIHVNLIIKYIEKRKERNAKRLLKAQIEEEKDRIEEQIENEQKMAEMIENNSSVEDSFVYYKAPDEDKIEELAEERVEKEKKASKKRFFFKESPEQKAISLVTGAVSGFLILAIMLMPVFYSMSVLSALTDGISNTDADDSQVYNTVAVIDEHIVEPYESSFVIQLYDSMALVDLMNYTTRAGGKIVLESGDVVYADDVYKGIISHTVRASSELTSIKSEHAHIGEDISAILNDPMIETMIVDAIVNLLKDVEAPVVEEGDLMGELGASFINHYKNADRETIASDISAIGDTMGVLAETGIIQELLYGDIDMETLIGDKERLKDFTGSIAQLSVFDPTMEGTFTIGIQMLGEMLAIPEDDKVAYDIFVDHLLLSINAETAAELKDPTFDMDSVEGFIKGCVESGKTPTEYGETDPLGAKNFIAYFRHWMSVQNAFMNSSEDLSYGYLVMDIDGKTYIYDIGASSPAIVEVTDANRDSYADKISPVAELIHYMVQNSEPSFTSDNLKSALEAYLTVGTDAASKDVATRLLDRETFVSKGVTINGMVASLDFEDWTPEEKKEDVGLCIDIIFNLLSIMESMAEQTPEGEDVNLDAYIDQFVVLGKTMDIMGQTSCMKELPSQILNGLVKNEMLSQIMSPVLVNKINNMVANDGYTYEQIMSTLTAWIKALT